MAISKNLIFKVVGALLIILSIVVIVVYDDKVVKWIIVSVSAALGLMLLYMSSRKLPFSEIKGLQNKLRDLLATNQLKLSTAKKSKFKFALGGMDTSDVSSFLVYLHQNNQLPLLPHELSAQQVNYSDVDYSKLNTLEMLKKLADLMGPGDESTASEILKMYGYNYNDIIAQDVQSTSSNLISTTPTSNLMPEKESSMKELTGDVEIIDAATLNARTVLKKYIDLLNQHDFNNPDNFSKHLCKTIVDSAHNIIDEPSNKERAQLKWTQAMEDGMSKVRTKLTIDDHSKPLIYTHTDILIPTTIIEKSNWRSDDKEFISDILSDRVPFIYNDYLIRVRSYVYNNYIDSLHLERHLKNLNNSDELVDYDWFVRMDRYIKSLTKKEVFILSSYSYVGDAYVNNYLRGTIDMDILTTDITDSKNWKEMMFPLYYQIFGVLVKLTRRMYEACFARLDTQGNQISLDAIDKHIQRFKGLQDSHGFVSYTLLMEFVTKYKFTPEFCTNVLDQYILDLNKIINNSPELRSELVVYRGCAESYIPPNVGHIYNNQGFLSTSLDIQIAKNFTFEQTGGYLQRILLLPGMHVMLLTGISQFSQEQEILLGSNTVYYIAKVDGATPVYKLNKEYSDSNSKISSVCDIPELMTKTFDYIALV